MDILDVRRKVVLALGPEPTPQVLDQGVIEERESCLFAILVKNIEELGLDVRQPLSHLILALRDQFPLLGDLGRLHHQENRVSSPVEGRQFAWDVEIFDVALCPPGNRLII